MWNAPFLNDDYTKILKNRHLTRTSLQKYTADSEAKIETVYFRPVNNAVIWLAHSVFGNHSVRPYRMIGIICLLLGAYFLGSITAALTRSSAAVWTAIVFFIIHPFNSWYYFQSVWIGNTLSVAFGALWLLNVMTANRTGQFNLRFLIFNALLTGLAVSSKESVLLFFAAFIPYLIRIGQPLRVKLNILISSVLPVSAYLLARRAALGSLWNEPLTEAAKSFSQFADVVSQYLVFWISGSNFVYGRNVVHHTGSLAGMAVLLLFLTTLACLMHQKKFRSSSFLWFAGAAMLEPVIGNTVAPGILCTRLTLFTAVCSVGAGVMVSSCLSILGNRASTQTDSIGNRIREICVPTMCLLIAWYAFQTSLHIIKSNDTDRFFRYHLKNPKGWNLLYAYANYLQSEGRTEEAEPFVIESTRVHPTSLTLNALGVSRAKKGKPEEGLNVFLDILAFDPDNVSALNNAGSSYNMLGDRMNAAIYFARAYTLDPKYIEVGANLVATYLQSSPEERIPMLEIIRNVQQPELLNQIGLNLARQGHLEDAISHFNIALFQDPGSSRTHSLIGKAYAATGKSVKGAEHFKKSIELNPNNAATFNDWGILEARSGNMQRAEELFSRAVDLDASFEEAKENLSRARQQI